MEKIYALVAKTEKLNYVLVLGLWVLGGALIIAMVLTIINLIVDISFVLIDPRLKTTIIAGGAKKRKAKAA